MLGTKPKPQVLGKHLQLRYISSPQVFLFCATGDWGIVSFTEPVVLGYCVLHCKPVVLGYYVPHCKLVVLG